MPITDAFTGTNGTGIVAYSSNWAYMAGSGTDFQIQSNGVSMAAVSLEGGVRRTETGFPADQYAQVALPVGSATTYVLGVAVRCQAAGSGDYYGFYGDNGSGTQLFKYDGVTWTQLGLGGSGIFNGDILKLTVSGTTLTPAVNGATQSPPGAQTDATYASGAPGISGFNVAQASANMRLDDFECTDVAVTAIARVSPRLIQTDRVLVTGAGVQAFAPRKAMAQGQLAPQSFIFPVQNVPPLGQATPEVMRLKPFRAAPFLARVAPATATPTVVTFDPALMAAMSWPWPQIVISQPQVVASGMTPPDNVPN